MKNKFLYKLRSGKNPKFIYYAINACRLLMPKFFFRMRLHNRLETLSRRNDRTYIEQRVNYYNKLTGPIKLPSTAPHLAEHKIGKQKVYFCHLPISPLVSSSLPMGFLSGRRNLYSSISFYCQKPPFNSP